MRRIGGNGTVPAEVAPTTQPEPASKGSKTMVLDAIRDTTSSKGEKIVLYAPEGWGKSTWASKSENPVFLSTEDGLKNIKAKTFPEPKVWPDIFDAVEVLRKNDHPFKTLVIDTADWTEHLCQKFIMERDKQNSIEDYGYGKGYVVAFEEWKRLKEPIDALRREKEMTIIFLAHMMIRTFNNPAGENFDRYEMKTDRRVSALLKEWADCVLFGTYDIAVDVKKGQTKGKGYGGDRIIHANHCAAFDAKNRYGIVKPITSNFAEFWKYVMGGN